MKKFSEFAAERGGYAASQETARNAAEEPVQETAQAEGEYSVVDEVGDGIVRVIDDVSDLIANGINDLAMTISSL